MPWCPKCKCEYREGITECADCKVALVDVLPPDEENPYSEESEMKQMEQWVLEDNEEPDDESMQTGQDADMESKIRNARIKGFFTHIVYMIGFLKPKSYPPSYMRYFLGG